MVVSADDPRARLRWIFERVTARIDGERLVATAGAVDLVFASATHVLAVGKAALPMLRGLPPAAHRRRVLAVTPPLLTAAIPDVQVPGVQVLIADHPRPSARSVAAARAVLAFVRTATAPGDADAGAAGARLLVLLSGGASALLCAPSDGLTWADKRDAIQAVARAGVPIRALNVVRKHLSAIKGGRLALAARGPIAVRALSDVIGDDPATIGSGPFSADPSTFSEALAIVEAVGAALPAAALDHLRRGARGERAETPKPGTPSLDHVAYQVLAGPARVVSEAQQAAREAGLDQGHALPRDSEDTVDDLAAAILTRAHQPGAPGVALDRPRLWIGNGEPRVVLPVGDLGRASPGAGRGGRATHLALVVARGLATLPQAMRARVAFLAAGTDDRDGETDVSGAIVDGTTWARAHARGLDPEQAIRRFDSLTVLSATGDTIRGPGTSNLLDLHLLLRS